MSTKSSALPALPSTGDAPKGTQAYPADTTAILRKLERDYQKSDGQPIAVSFRDLVPWIRMGERATHYVHSYPAKLLPQIAHFFLAANGWLDKDELVLDPFGGTGTVALEAHLSGRSALYADVNPLARLIASAKTSHVNIELAIGMLDEIRTRFEATQASDADVPWVVNVDLWYEAPAKADLARLRRSLLDVKLDANRDFVWATFSSTARKCSRANPRFAVPVRLKAPTRSPSIAKSVWTVFSEQYLSNLQRHKQLQRLIDKPSIVHCVGNDARELLDPLTSGLTTPTRLNAASIGLVLTSPPYAGAQKYVRASSLNLGWLGMTGPQTLKQLESASIGREHFAKAALEELPEIGIDEADALIRAIAAQNRVRAAICSHYLVEMDEAIKEVARVLKPGGKAVIVIGDNTVCGLRFPSAHFLGIMLGRHGLRASLRLIDDIKSRGLLMKRSGGVAAIQSETILVFEK